MNAPSNPVIFMRDERLKAEAAIEPDPVSTSPAAKTTQIIAIYGKGELGEGLVAIEMATVASLPPQIASSDSAGGAAMRLRIPHRITHVTLHHTGDSKPLRREDDPCWRARQVGGRVSCRVEHASGRTGLRALG